MTRIERTTSGGCRRALLGGLLLLGSGAILTPSIATPPLSGPDDHAASAIQQGNPARDTTPEQSAAGSQPPLAPDPVAVPAPAEDAYYPDEMPTPWLDEVRIQRQAWEARREATRNAYEARRRASNPRAAAQQEAWEEDVRRRRTERFERMDQEREHFRRLGPGAPPWSDPWAWPMDPPYPPLDLGLETPPPPPGEAESPRYAPPGWDNHWYFRGF